MTSSKQFFDFKLFMKRKEHHLEQEPQKCEYGNENKSDDTISDDDNKITEIDRRQNPIFLLFDGCSAINIFYIENDIFMFDDDSFHSFILSITRKHNI